MKVIRLMRRKPVQSSTLRSIGFNEDTDTLELEFTSHEVYHYHDVPYYLYKELMNASSVGKYFNEYIKDQYPTVKVSR